MMLASAAHPNFFSPAIFKDYGSLISGDSVSLSPSLFAFVNAIQDHGLDPSQIRLVNVGATEVKIEPLPTNYDSKIDYIKDLLVKQTKMNYISAFHAERPVRQVFRDYLFEIVREKHDNDQFYQFNYGISAQSEEKLYKMSNRVDTLQEYSKKMQKSHENELKEVLK